MRRKAIKDPFRAELANAKRLLSKLDKIKQSVNKGDAFGISLLRSSTSDLIDIASRSLRAAADAVASDIENHERQNR